MIALFAVFAMTMYAAIGCMFATSRLGVELERARKEFRFEDIAWDWAKFVTVYNVLFWPYFMVWRWLETDRRKFWDRVYGEARRRAGDSA